MVICKDLEVLRTFHYTKITNLVKITYCHGLNSTKSDAMKFGRVTQLFRYERKETYLVSFKFPAYLIEFFYF